MNRKPVQILLVITILLAIPVSSAYFSYYTIASADFLSANLGFEAFDQEYLAAAHQSELKIFDSSNFFKTVELEIAPFGLFPRLFSQVSSFDQKTLVLRC